MDEIKTTNYKHFSHKTCEYYPCHKGADPETFNCLFCYCPLYALGPNCGGHFRYLESGVKDCSHCMIPHGPDGFDHVMDKMPQLIEQVRRKKPGEAAQAPKSE
jgi:Zn-finger protein